MSESFAFSVSLPVVCPCVFWLPFATTLLSSSEPIEMAFGADVTRDETWEHSFRTLFEQHSGIVDEPNALLFAGNGLVSAGSKNSVIFC